MSQNSASAMSEATHPDHQFLSADRPIQSAREDLLGRGTFAGQLAQAIRSWSGDDSLVIALCGAWGSGKTSIKNLVLELLRRDQPLSRPWYVRALRWLARRRDISPHREQWLVEFSPWEWAGSDQIAREFFEELGAAIGHSAVGRAFRRVVARIAPVLGGTSIAIQLIAFVLFVAAAGLAIAGALGKPYLTAVGLGAIAVGAMATRLSAVRSEVGAGITHGSLVDLKKALGEQLRKTNQSVIIVLDDIDRLSPEEIRLVFRLVKANANLPRLTYLLLFQHDVVASALDRGSGTEQGAAFLEKIVQVRLDVPTAGQGALQGLLFKELDAVLAPVLGSQRFDHKRWANVFEEGLSGFFQTLRDVKRFLATFEFHFAIFHQDGTLEVNAIDLIALEALRLFSPGVYERLPEHKELLLQSGFAAAFDNAQKTEVRQRLAQLVSAAGQAQKSQVGALLSHVFPKAAWAWGPAQQVNSDHARSELRACAPDLFDRYFRLFIAPEEIRQSEVDLLRAACRDRDSVTRQLELMRSQGKLASFLRVLDGIPIPVAPELLPLVQALCDALDIPVEENDPPDPLTIRPDMHALRILHQHVMQLTDQADRLARLSAAFSQCRGLFLPAATTALENESDRGKEDPEAFLLSPEQARELIPICLTKIRAARDSGTLLAHPRLGFLLVRWHNWAETEYASWFNATIASDAGLLAILRSFRGATRIYGGREVQERPRIDLQGLAAVTDLPTLRARVVAIDRAQLPEEDRTLLEIFDHSPENPVADMAGALGD